jgi:hypothetical protein
MERERRRPKNGMDKSIYWWRVFTHPWVYRIVIRGVFFDRV